jgi:hypothetical protein
MGNSYHTNFALNHSSTRISHAINAARTKRLCGCSKDSAPTVQSFKPTRILLARAFIRDNVCNKVVFSSHTRQLRLTLITILGSLWWLWFWWCWVFAVAAGYLLFVSLGLGSSSRKRRSSITLLTFRTSTISAISKSLLLPSRAVNCLR